MYKNILKTLKDYKYLVIFIIFLLSIKIILYLFTHFNKNITIKNKYLRYRRRSSNYHIVDSNDKLYQIDNVWFLGDFNRAEDYNRLTKGKSYEVKGFGIRIPFLDMYPIIYSLS